MAVCFELKEILSNAEADIHLLVGWKNADTAEIVNCIAVVEFASDGGIDWLSELKFLTNHLPSGNVLEVVGVCGRWPKEQYDFSGVHAAAKSVASVSDNAFTISDTLIVGTLAENGELDFQTYDSANKQFAAFDVKGLSEKPCSSGLSEHTTLCRLKATVKLSFQFAAGEVYASCKSLGEEFNRVHRKLSSDSSGFFVGSSLVTRNDACDKTVAALCSSACKEAKHPIVPIRQTYQLSSRNRDNLVPVIGTETCVGERVHLSCPLDATLLVRSSTLAPQLHTLCTDALTGQLSLLHSRLESSLKHGSPLCTHRPHHFRLPHSPHHTVTVLYPCRQLNSAEDVAEDSLESTRRELHHRFNLPMNRPLLRKHMALGASVSDSVYLSNVHVSLNVSSANGGEVSMVQGIYTYHHYMQDHFNDDGWGCAYRSLQTLWSWFTHQGYTGLAVPTHRQIQQALVDVEDKPAKFVGSKQWIGSIEVQTVLNQLMQVDSRIVFVMNGASMSSHAREIAMHFQQQGTPIMIGGGTLAHTIIGIDFNDRTGDVRYLILDPHYTGGENIGVIQNKGWCGWKNNSFWDQHAHYNMCMPLRPDII